MGILKVGKCTPWHVYVLKAVDEIRRETLHEKVGSLDAMILLPRRRADDERAEKTCFTTKGTDHISIISHPQPAQPGQLAADEPMASEHLRQWVWSGLGDTESWGWNLVLQVKGPLCVCIRGPDRACGY